MRGFPTLKRNRILVMYLYNCIQDVPLYLENENEKTPAGPSSPPYATRKQGRKAPLAEADMEADIEPQYSTPEEDEGSDKPFTQKQVL